jgi:polyisoprenoid-binding protein YceI
MASTQQTAARTKPAVPPGIWDVDPGHSRVGFSVKHMGIATVRGHFERFEGRIEVGEDLASTHTFGKTDVASIDTNQGQRDEHLRSPDFFDAERFPEATFASTRIEPTGETTAHVHGDLMMHGVTREVCFEVIVQGAETDPWGNERTGLEATAMISRADFDMKFNQALGSGNMLVGDKVTINLDLSLVKRA